MSLQTRLADLITAIGTDIKTLKSTAAMNPAIVLNAKRTADVGLVVNWNGPVSFPTESVDSDGFWNGTRFQPTRAGWYRVGAQVAISGGTSGGGAELHISKNATGTSDAGAKTVADDVRSVRSDGWIKMSVSELVFFNGTTDYVEVFIFMGNTATLRGTSTANISTINAESVGAAGPTGATGPQGPGTTILSRVTELVDTQESGSAVEWRLAGALLGKLITMNPIVGDLISNRSELWIRVKSRDGLLSQSRKLLDSDGQSDFIAPLVTALPTTGPSGGALIDGQECMLTGFVAPNDKVVWHLKYNTATLKWHFVGGPPLYAEVTNQDSTGSTGAYVGITNAGPSIAIPVAGDYMVSQGAVHNQNTASANSFMSYDIGATGAVDADGIFWQNSTALNAYTPGTRTRRKTLTAVTLTSKYKASAGVSTFRDRWMSVTPIRLG